MIIMYGGIPQQVIGSTSTQRIFMIFIYGLGAVISSLRRVRGGRGLFTSDDITAPSQALAVVFRHTL